MCKLNTKMFSSFRNMIVLITSCLLVLGCAKDIVDLSGSIRGVVKDSNTSSLLANCQVSLSPGGKSVFTGADGHFEFSSLDPGTYTLSFTRVGYEDATKTVKVVSGETSETNIALKAKSAFALSDTELNFGDLSTTMVLTIFNNSDELCAFTISNMPSWATISHTSGTIAAISSMSVAITVDRNNVDYGTYKQMVNIAYTGKTKGTAYLTIQMQKVELTTPTVDIASAAEEIKQTSFNIGGELKATGGAIITSYGHCWSVLPNPTIDAQKTNLGTRTDIGEFKSIISGLSTATKYYVRAYATNQYGTTYSKQIEVTTQDIASNKWDGSLASSFAGGSGSSADPYIIENGGQFLLMKDYDTNNKYFELANNIDLNNINWLPFEFKGTLDGKGYTISNLKVIRSTEGQGLFSETEGATIKNLTIKNVNIVAPSVSYIGALAGYISTSSVINCKVILTEESQITGDQCVGGLVGGSDNYTNCSIIESSVEYAGTSSEVIKGNKFVGGIVGETFYSNIIITSCIAQVNIKGAENVGGICGYSYPIRKAEIKQCSYKGKIEGEEGVGGIVGSAGNPTYVIASKSDVELTATNGYGGGITGCGGDVLACYSTGIIKGLDSKKYYGGLMGVGSYIKMSYSTISSTLSYFDGIIGGYYSQSDIAYCASTAPSMFTGTNQGECSDITTFLKECYQSDGDQYWNYNKTWTWSGTINGNTATVSCPLLKWE